MRQLAVNIHEAVQHTRSCQHTRLLSVHNEGEHRDYPADVALQQRWAINRACDTICTRTLYTADNGQVNKVTTRGAAEHGREGQL